MNKNAFVRSQGYLIWPILVIAAVLRFGYVTTLDHRATQSNWQLFSDEGADIAKNLVVFGQAAVDHVVAKHPSLGADDRGENEDAVLGEKPT